MNTKVKCLLIFLIPNFKTVKKYLNLDKKFYLLMLQNDSTVHLQNKNKIKTLVK